MGITKKEPFKKMVSKKKLHIPVKPDTDSGVLLTRLGEKRRWSFIKLPSGRTLTVIELIFILLHQDKLPLEECLFVTV